MTVAAQARFIDQVGGGLKSQRENLGKGWSFGGRAIPEPQKIADLTRWGSQPPWPELLCAAAGRRGRGRRAGANAAAI